MVVPGYFRLHADEKPPAPRVAGFRQLGEKSVELETESAPEGGWKVCSERRGVPLRAEGRGLRVLNLASHVTTIVCRDGWRLWGGRTCSSDPKWAFLSVVRTADRINRALLEAHLWAVDRSITRTYTAEVVESANAFLRELEADGAILGGECWADGELNTPAAVAAGRNYFDVRFTPSYPAERVTFRSRLVDDYVETIFT